ncbi:hypothetical protein [Microbacterium sp. NPDC055455]
MTGTPLPPDAELAALRERAYGAVPDIWDDPAALARLAELEDAHALARIAPKSGGNDDPPTHAPAPTVRDDPESRGELDAESLAPGGRGPARREGRGHLSTRWWVAGVLAVVPAVLVLGGARLLEARPDATLAAIDMTDVDVVQGIQAAWGSSAAGLEEASFHAHQSFRGIEPWSGVDDFGNPCLFLIDRPATVPLDYACTPSSADVFVDLGAWPALDQDFAEGLPDGSVLRFRLRDGTVDVFVHLAPASD